jgi:hypothetical protein
LCGWPWGGGVGVGAADDVGVTEEAADIRAGLVGCRRRDGSTVDRRLAVGVDGRADGGVAAVAHTAAANSVVATA